MNLAAANTKILNVFSVISLALIASFSLLSWKWADDFEMYNLINHYGGVFNYLFNRYMLWDGRFASLNSLLQALLIHYASVKLSVFIWTVSFIASATTMYMLLHGSYKTTINQLNGKKLIGIAITTAALWLGMLYILAQVLYWQTGGTYAFAMLIGIFWLYVLHKKQKQASSTAKIFFSLLSLFAGMASHNLTVALIAFLIVQWLMLLIKKKSKLIIYLGLIGLLAGGIIVFAAPGNYVRLSNYNVEMSFGITHLIKSFFIILFRYSYFSAPLFVSAFVSGIVYSHLWKINLVSTPLKNGYWYLQRIKYLVPALGTIAFFLPAPFLAEPRTAVFFMLFMFLFIADNTVYFYSILRNKFSILSKLPTAMLVKFVLLVHITVAAYELKKGIEIRPQITARENILKQHQNKQSDLVLQPIDSAEVPLIMQFNDINEKPGFWVNQQMAKYYGINTVKLDYVITKK